MEYTSLAWPSCNNNSCAVATSHNLHVPSKLALPKYLPEGWKPILATRLACPFNVAMGDSLILNMSMLSSVIVNAPSTIYLSKFHSWINPSAPLDAKFKALFSWEIVASGWKATPPTLSLWPFNVNTFSQLGTVHTLQSPDHDPVTSNFESGLKAHWAIGRSSAICEDQFEYALSLVCSSFLLAFNKANGMLDSSFCRSFLCLALVVIVSIIKSRFDICHLQTLVTSTLWSTFWPLIILLILA